MHKLLILGDEKEMDFNYFNPKTLTELLNDLNGMSDYALLAGGTDLLVKIKDGVISRKNVLDINDLQELKGIKEEGEYLHLGPLVTHLEAEESTIVKKKAYILAEAASQVGSPQIRSMGTLGGNIANASPAADTVPALLVLDTKVEIQSTNGKEEKDLLDIFKGPGKLSITDGQVITNLKVSCIKENEGAAFIKFGKRKSLSISVINGAIWLKVEDKEIKDVRLAFGSVAPTAIRLFEIEKWLIGKKAEEKVFAEAGLMAKEFIKPIDDIRSTANYRKLMASQVVSKGLNLALQRIQEA